MLAQVLLHLLLHHGALLQSAFSHRVDQKTYQDRIKGEKIMKNEKMRIVHCPKGGRVPEGYCRNSCLNHPGAGRIDKSGGNNRISAGAPMFKARRQTLRERSRVYFLILIMATACLLVTGIAIVLLYNAALREQGERLRVLAQSQARLIEAIARYDRLHGIAYPGGSTKATLTQITDAHGRYPGFGKTGEFTLAHRVGNSIVFLLRHRHTTLESPKPIPLDSRFAEPMRRALKGNSGTIIAEDYKYLTKKIR